MWPTLLTAIIAFAIAALTVGWLSRSRVSTFALDQPNARSLHTTPVPRTGGLGLLTGVAGGWLFAGFGWPWPIWAGLALVFSISLLDDLRGMPAAFRLAAHLVAAVCITHALLDSPLSLTALAMVLILAWCGNLYNFMDGADGLAGGMALFGFSAYAWAAWRADDAMLMSASLALAGAAGGFLFHNFHPARIFLGDAGAVPLGFLAATLGLAGWLKGVWPWWFPLLVFSPFVVDASLTLLRRLASGARVWDAHREHYYQRLVRLGLGHRNTALAEYALMLICAIAGTWALGLGAVGRLALLLVAVVLYAGLLLRIEHVWRQRGPGHA